VETLRKAQRAHPTVGGNMWVIPGPHDPSDPCRGNLMTKWWNRAVSLARLPPKERRRWHSLPRKFAADLQDAATVDLLKLGGWTSLPTLMRCYQGADKSSMKAALEGRAKRVG